MMVTDNLIVVPEEGMDTETFLLHLRHRHPESRPAGVDPLEWFVSDYVEECYRIFHAKLHELRVDIRHSHEEHRQW
jgi:hypothetical protein